MLPERSYLARVRGVALLPGERVRALLDPASGMIEEPTRDGQLLVATDHRLIHVMDSGDTQARQMFAVSTVAGASVRNDVRRGLSWRQWVFLIVGGLVAYVALAYWLVDRLPSIIIPGINLHAFAVVVALLLVSAGWLFWQGLTKPGGRHIQIHGINWNVELDCAAGYEDLMEFSHALSRMRFTESGRGHSPGSAERE